MLRTLTLSFFLLLLTSFTRGQRVFVSTFGFGNTNDAYGVFQTGDTGYAITGTTTGTWNENPDMFLMHADSLGNFQWVKLFGGNNIEQGKSFIQTQDGGYLLVGYTNSFNLTNDYNGYLVRTDVNGNTIWTKIVGGNNWDMLESVAPCPDHGFLLAGTTYGTSSGHPGGWLMRIDSSGNTLWQKNLESVNDLFLKNIHVLSDGNYVVCGFYKDDSNSKEQGFVAKIEPLNGDTIWTYARHGSDATHLNAVKELSNGDLAFAGYIEADTNANKDEYFYGLKASGIFNWENRFVQPGRTEGYNDLVIVNDTIHGAGSTSTFGSGNQDFRLMRANSSGQYIEANNWGGGNDEICYHIESTLDTGFILVGSTSSYAPSRQSVYLVKTDRHLTTTSLITIDVPEFTNNNPGLAFPNPFHASLKIRINNIKFSGQSSEIRIFSSTGELVESRSTNETELEINGENFASGIYLLQIIRADGSCSVSRLIRE